MSTIVYTLDNEAYGNPRMLMVHPMECHDGDVLIGDNDESMTIGKIETLCVPGEHTMYRVCDRYDSRIGLWFEAHDLIYVLRGPHRHTTHRCL